MNYSRATEQNESLRGLNSHKKQTLCLLLVILVSIGGCSSKTDSVEVAHASPSTTAPDPPPIHVKLDQDLGKTLDQLLSSPEFTQARWGVAVLALKDGKLIYEHNGDGLFTPASNMK